MTKALKWIIALLAIFAPEIINVDVNVMVPPIGSTCIAIEFDFGEDQFAASTFETDAPAGP